MKTQYGEIVFDQYGHTAGAIWQPFPFQDHQQWCAINFMTATFPHTILVDSREEALAWLEKRSVAW